MPRWQHPLIAIGVTLFVVVTVVAAISFGTSSRGPAEGASAGPSPDPSPSTAPADPTPLPQVPLEPPVAPAPVLRIEAERPPRSILVEAVDAFLGAWRADDPTRLAGLTWSNCRASGRDIAAELDARLGGQRSSVAAGRIIVVTATLGAVDLVDSDGGALDRLVFRLEDELWRSGVCPDVDDDLGSIIRLPADLTGVAGLSFEGESMAAEVLQRRDLAYAVFDGAMLRQANLYDADIEGASFVGADLAEVWAPDVDSGVQGAVFDDADLTRAVFLDANLTGSSFAGADARSVDFSGAVLDDVDFRGANLDGAFIDRIAAAAVTDWTGAICPDGETALETIGCLENLNPYG